MKRQKILITGSKGTIGRILVNALSDSPFDIYGIDCVEGKSQKNNKIDISNYEELDKTFKKISCIKYVIHLAADHRVNADWKSVLKNNIIGTRNLYECAKKYKIKKMIFASSSHVTGAYEGFPPSLHKQPHPKMITINNPIRPDSDYGTSKVFGEAVARQYFELYGVESICLRIGTVIEDDDPTQNKRFMKTWLSHRDLIQLIRKGVLSQVKFGIYYGVSNNKGGFWDISNAEKEIGYKPRDDASS